VKKTVNSQQGTVTPTPPSQVTSTDLPTTPEKKELSREEKENYRLEYQMCQEMLRHYDTLNWQIGSIFIAAVFLLVGTSLPGLLESAAKFEYGFPLIIALSAILMFAWLIFFLRHRAIYNVRNYRLKKLEELLGYEQYKLNFQTFKETKKLPGSDGKELNLLEKISGWWVAIAVAFAIPLSLLGIYIWILRFRLLPLK
jgi:hypothetical protein